MSANSEAFVVSPNSTTKPPTSPAKVTSETEVKKAGHRQQPFAEALCRAKSLVETTQATPAPEPKSFPSDLFATTPPSRGVSIPTESPNTPTRLKKKKSETTDDSPPQLSFDF